MNIFVLDTDPVLAARHQCDKHVVKMCLETAQLLCTALSYYGLDAQYKPTHKSHPCTKWVTNSRENFLWLSDHGLALCAEYTNRYGKIHKCQTVIATAKTMANALPSSGLTEFAQAMPDKYKNPCAVTAYRNYYINEKLPIATWKLNRPVWLDRGCFDESKV